MGLAPSECVQRPHKEHRLLKSGCIAAVHVTHLDSEAKLYKYSEWTEESLTGSASSLDCSR